jgi:trigger factor
MEPGEFIQILDKNGQIPGMIAEVGRAKALAVVLDKAKVVDSNGKAVDVSAFTATVKGADDEFDVSDMTAALQGAGGHDDHDGHDHGSTGSAAAGGKDSHGRKANHEHYGHDHS